MELFSRLRTQWRMGPSGATGLDYGAAYPLLDRLGLSAPDWDALLADLQVMEAEALSAMHETED